MKIKNLSAEDIKTLEMCAPALDRCNGVSGTVSTLNKNDVGVMGDAWVLSKIDSSTAEVIWDMAGMSKDDPRSAYSQVMTSEGLQLYLTVFKSGGLFSSIFVVNAAIMFSGKQVAFGVSAAKSIPQLIDRVRMMLMGQKALEGDTATALARVG